MTDEIKKRVFISHASEDREKAMEFCRLLEARGVTCWIAPRDINAGNSYAEAIVAGIENAEAMAVIISSDANKSAFIRNEVERGFSKGKKIVPILLEDIKLSAGLEFYLGAFQWTRAWQTSLAVAADEVLISLGGEVKTTAFADKDETRPVSARFSRLQRIFVSIAGLALIGVIGTFLFKSGDQPRGTSSQIPAPKTAATAVGPVRYHAIIIGISEYQSQNGDGWNPLKTARHDAESVADTLEGLYGFSVERLFDHDATAKAIMVSLDSLSRMTTNDAVLIYFAGHGYLDSQQGEGYWIPSDARRSVTGRPSNEDWIWNTIVARILDTSPARHILLVSDSCYSGSFFRDQQMETAPTGDQTWYRRLMGRPSRYAITSGDLEPVMDGSGVHSIFAVELLNALEHPGNPVFAASELAQNMRKGVAQLTRQMMRSGALALSADGGGEMIFVRKGTPQPEPWPEDGQLTRSASRTTSSVTSDQLLQQALRLASQGATNSTAQVVGSLLGNDGGNSLARAVAAYLDRSQKAVRTDAVREMIKTLDEKISIATNTAAGQPPSRMARPRIVACLGPTAKGGGDEQSALLYRISLTEELRASNTCFIVEREALEQILQEQNLAVSALADSRAGSIVGRLMPASFLVMGDLIPGNAGDFLSMRLVDTDTSVVLTSLTATRSLTGTVPDVCRTLGQKLRDKVKAARPLTAHVIEIKAGRLAVGMGKFHGAQPGMTVSIARRKATAITGQNDYSEEIVGSGGVAAVSELSCEIEPVWKAGRAPADASELWVRETAP